MYRFLFLLIFCPDLFQAFVRELPNKEERLRAIRLVTVTQRQLSRYIATVSVINTGLGLATATALYAIGLEDVGFWTELLENCGLICMVQGGIIKELDLGQVQELHGGSGVMATHRNLEQVLTMHQVRQEHTYHHQACNCRIWNIPQWNGCDDK